MVCKNICERLGCKPSFEYNQYIDGKKYCRRCETYFYHNGLFCPCCGMQLRRTPSTKNGKERLRRRVYVNRTLKGPSSKIKSLKTNVTRALLDQHYENV